MEKVALETICMYRDSIFSSCRTLWIFEPHGKAPR